jgi:hypothetical protein
MKCVASIGHYDHVIVIDNSGTRECEDLLKSFPGIRVLFQKENIGVSRSWNLVIDEVHDWTFIVSASMYFPKKFDHIIDMVKEYDGLVFRTNHVWHCIGLSRKAIELVGKPDENFYPGYLEDCDWDYRFMQTKEKEYGNIEIDAICQVNGGATKDGVQVNIRPLRQYFINKWGGPELKIDPPFEYSDLPTVWEGGSHIYTRPFNNPDNDLSYWEPASIEELKIRYGLPL